MAGRPSEWRAKLTDDVLFEAIDLLTKTGSAEKVAAKFRPTLGESFTRQQAYKLLGIAVAEKLLILQPPRVDAVAEQLSQKYSLPKDALRVVGVRGPSAPEYLAFEAAGLLLDLIMHLKEERSRKTVHLALGSGRSTNLVCARLGTLLRERVDRPNLVIHALTGGWDAGALVSPVSHFAHFQFEDQPTPTVEFVNLSVPPLVPVDQFRTIEQLPFIQEAFARADTVDIVITSIGYRHDEDCTFAAAMDLKWVSEHGNPKKKLERQGWIGDVQYLPYSASGPIKMSDLKACVLVDIPRLVKMAEGRDKYVVVVVGPCGRCGKSKAPALLPLVSARDLRVFSHLIFDLTTGEEMLA